MDRRAWVMPALVPSTERLVSLLERAPGGLTVSEAAQAAGEEPVLTVRKLNVLSTWGLIARRGEIPPRYSCERPDTAIAGGPHTPYPLEIGAAGAFSVLFEFGDFSLEGWRQTLEALIGGPRFAPGSGLLWDRRRATRTPEPEESRAVAQHLVLNAEALGGGRVAILVLARDVAYGIARITANLADGTGLDVEVFTDYRSACAWLREATAESIGRRA